MCRMEGRRSKKKGRWYLVMWWMLPIHVRNDQPEIAVNWIGLIQWHSLEHSLRWVIENLIAWIYSMLISQYISTGSDDKSHSFRSWFRKCDSLESRELWYGRKLSHLRRFWWRNRKRVRIVVNLVRERGECISLIQLESEWLRSHLRPFPFDVTILFLL